MDKEIMQFAKELVDMEKKDISKDFTIAELTEIEQEEIARLITDGITSGRLDGENETVAWKLHFTKWDN